MPVVVIDGVAEGVGLTVRETESVPLGERELVGETDGVGVIEGLTVFDGLTVREKESEPVFVGVIDGDCVIVRV